MLVFTALVWLAAVAAGPELTIGVAVPCLPKNVASGELFRLMATITAQTVLPDEVVVAISETSDGEGLELQDALRFRFPLVPDLRVLPDTAKMFVGGNNNRAVRAIRSDVVVVMDADDEMVPAKLAVTKAVMGETDAKCLLHTFLWVHEKGSIASTDYDWHHANHTDGNELYRRHAERDGPSFERRAGSLAWRGADGRQAAQGHLTCRRWVLQDSPYNTNIERGSDSLQVRALLKRYQGDPSTFKVLDLPLTVYLPSDHPRNEWTKQFIKPVPQPEG